MKFAYCPKCKDLMVKPWYSRREHCPRCRGPTKMIDVPNTYLTYVLYALMAVIIALVYVNTTSDQPLFLYVAVALLAVLMAIQFAEISRGAKHAKSRIRATSSDVNVLRKKGWL